MPDKSAAREAVETGKETPAAAPLYQLKITLKWSDPPIWRRVLVRGDMTLDRLHTVIQIAMEWDNSHMHQFIVGPLRSPVFIGSLEPDFGFGDDTIQDERSYTVERIAQEGKRKFGYEYDFGDSWHHEVKVEKVLPPDATHKHPVCLAGENAAPPEDCGGIGGYYNLLDAVADPAHPEHEDLKNWLGDDFDPTHFDLAEVNRILARRGN